MENIINYNIANEPVITGLFNNYESKPVCPLCGSSSNSLVNCGAHEYAFNNSEKLKSAKDELIEAVGHSGENAFIEEERDCLICAGCRNAYSGISSFCPLYVLYQGVHAFIEEQQTMFNRNEEDANNLLWNLQAKNAEDPNTIIHRYKITTLADPSKEINLI